MAKIEGTQNIPAEWLDIYRSNLLDGHPEGVIRKRYPYRLPKMQEGGTGISEAQQSQRQRFKDARDIFKTLTPEERQRWYESEPPWSSFLWYYNYCIMSALAGNANISEGGAGVIKSIQTVPISMPSGAGEGSASITTIDPAKAVVMINGASIGEGQTGDVPYACLVYPYVSDLTTILVKCKWSIAAPFGNATKAATISATVIEYI